MTTNPAQPTEADLANSQRCIDEAVRYHEHGPEIQSQEMYLRNQFAIYLADERRAMQERCAQLCEETKIGFCFSMKDVASAIRSLT